MGGLVLPRHVSDFGGGHMATITKFASQSPDEHRQYVYQSIAFVSTCPSCGHPQHQHGSRRALQRLLNGPYPIEAYCVVCDLFWPITAAERIAVASDVSG